MVLFIGLDLLYFSLTQCIECNAHCYFNIKANVFNRMGGLVRSVLQTWIITCSIEFMIYTLNEFRR
jgi:hypothetical protein